MTKLLLLGMVLPVVVCAATMIGAWRPWRPDASIAGGLWAGAVALGLAFVPAFLAVEQWPGLPPHVTWHWLAWLAAIAAVAGVTDAMVRWPTAVRLLGAATLAAVCGRLLVGDWVDHAWSWRAVTAAVVAVVAVLVNVAAERRPGAAVPLSMCVAALGASVVLLGSGSAKLAQLAGALAACLGVAVALSWWRPNVSLSRGGVAVIAVLLPGLVLSGYFSSYSEIPPWVYVLAAVAPVAAWPAALIRLEGLRAWQATTIRVAVASIPVAITVAVAVLALIRREADSAYPY
jgi:hypothetical protein